jgi:hypothetical protein
VVRWDGLRTRYIVHFCITGQVRSVCRCALSLHAFDLAAADNQPVSLATDSGLHTRKPYTCVWTSKCVFLQHAPPVTTDKITLHCDPSRSDDFRSERVYRLRSAYFCASRLQLARTLVSETGHFAEQLWQEGRAHLSAQARRTRQHHEHASVSRPRERLVQLWTSRWMPRLASVTSR